MNIKAIVKNLFIKLYQRNRIYSVNNGNDRNALVLYITRPFFGNASNAHQNSWQATEIVKILTEMGYNVDIIDYYNYDVKLKRKYDLIFDICPVEHPVYEKKMKSGCKRIVYFTGSNSTFANAAELKRLDDLYERRGVRLQPRRQAPLIPRIVEEFDANFLIGNEYNMETYHKEFNLPPTHLIPNTGYDFEKRFDIEKLVKSGERKASNFLYFGSAGCVHKGLDRLLEIFSEPEFPCTLYVCGSFDEEKDFIEEYKKELYGTANIVPIGFLDIDSKEFEKIAGACAFTLLPSCSEGMAGSINTAISAGIIPICSRECGFNGDEVILLKDCEINTIREMVLQCSNRDDEWILKEAKRVLEISKTRYSKEAFSKAMRDALEQTL